MSRAGKYPVEFSTDVSVKNIGTALEIKGPKGILEINLETKNANLVDINIEANHVLVVPKNEKDKESRTMWGTMARNIKAAIVGVTDGYSIPMYMNGVGFRASISAGNLVMNAGFSHDVIFEIPKGITVEIGATPTEFAVNGIDKNMVGQFADKIRKVRKDDPYKGKGIFYKGEKIHRKEGKKK